jgi:hypothetical protein
VYPGDAPPARALKERASVMQGAVQQGFFGRRRFQRSHDKKPRLSSLFCIAKLCCAQSHG